MRSRRFAAVALCGLLALGVAACSDDDDGDDASTDTTEASDTTEAPSSGSDTTDPPEDDMVTPVGAACSAIPTDGEGSSAGMADDPAATAASNNPELSTLVTAATAAGLVDTLNDTSAEYTIFAPANDAFAKIPAADLEALLADQAALTDVLTYHVYAGDAYSLEELPESLEMVNGGTVEIAPDGETAMINGESVVICGNVTTANGTVHIIDTVLMPS